MKDTFLAILGRKHCDWCAERNPTWWDRRMRFDQALVTKERPWHERIAMKVSDFNTDTLPLWKAGRWWHGKFHSKYTSL